MQIMNSDTMSACLQVAKNGLVALIESIRVRLLLLWNAQRWTKSRAAKHSPYFARLAEAERSAAKHKIAESDSEDEGKRNERKAFRRLEALGRGTSKSSFDSSLTRHVPQDARCSHLLLIFLLGRPGLVQDFLG